MAEPIFKKVNNLKIFAKELNNIIESANKYIQNLPNDMNEFDIINIKEKLIWISDYLNINNDREYLQTQEIPDLVRGDIVLVKIGENLGMEFSGDHPAVILRDSSKANDQVLLLPLTTKKPKKYNPNIKSIYLEFKRIEGMLGYQNHEDKNDKDNGKHWCNILNVKSVSKSRIKYPPEVKIIDGDDLRIISAAIISQIALKRIKQNQ